MLSRSTRRGRARVAALVLCVPLAGCFVGERPTLRDEPVVDDAATRSVFDRLSLAASADFVATYRITPTGAGDAVDAIVDVSTLGYRVRIRDVEYRVEPGSARTCTITTDECVDELDEARLSDLNITHRFWGESFRTRLSLDAARRIGFTDGSDETIADAPAACVDLTVPSSVDASGTVRYCALDAGPLARYVGADVVIELVAFNPTSLG